jgi:hypothetical protein
MKPANDGFCRRFRKFLECFIVATTAARLGFELAPQEQQMWQLTKGDAFLSGDFPLDFATACSEIRARASFRLFERRNKLETGAAEERMPPHLLAHRPGWWTAANAVRCSWLGAALA